MRTDVLKLKEDGRFNGVHLTPEELELLQHLHEFKSIHARNVHKYYEITSDGKRKGNMVTNRLAKLVASGILFQMNDKEPKREVFRPVNYAYRLGVRGIEVLANQGLFSHEEIESKKKYSYLVNIPTLHNMAINSLFMEVYRLMWERGESFESLNVRSNRGENHALIDSISRGRELQPIIPDWIYETERRIICLEVDSGSQTLGTIENKIARYNLLANKSQKPITVFFSVGLVNGVDGESRSRDRRVASIKETLKEGGEWAEGLEIFAAPSNRAPKILHKLISRQSAVGRLQMKNKTNQWIMHANKNSPAEFTFSISQNDLVLQKLIVEDRYDLDLLVEIRTFEDRKIGVLLFMEEGSVLSYQRARANVKRIVTQLNEAMNARLKTSLFLIYENTEAAANDVVALNPKCEIIISNLDEVKAPTREDGVYRPLVTKVATPFTRSEGNILCSPKTEVL